MSGNYEDTYASLDMKGKAKLGHFVIGARIKYNFLEFPKPEQKTIIFLLLDKGQI
jgi:hypothetical protein